MIDTRSMLARWLLITALATAVQAQPSPDVQGRISQAISNAGNGSVIDWTAFVNPFIGTDTYYYGDVCPGASLPFGMVKFTTDNTGYAPAGYVSNASELIRGMSPLHDSGTGSSLGSYGNFEILPLLCPDGFDSCTTTIENRLIARKEYTDDAYPGYFAQTLENDIKLEATATRRAGLERFTFPGGEKPYFVLDLSNDLPASFQGGSMTIDPPNGRIQLGGRWQPSFGPSYYTYQAFACYDLLTSPNQTLSEYGVWTGDTYGLDAKGLSLTHLNLSVSLIGGTPYQSGALFSFEPTPDPILIRVGVSFVSADQACANAEEEVGNATFEEVMATAKAAWNDKLSRIELDVPNTQANVTELLYSSLYRSFLTPNNATGEGQGLFLGTTSPYFDSLYCSWDTFRTFYPLLSLHSPVEYGQIVENYIDGWRKNGWLPECRSNNMPGYTQGGSDGTNILADFAVKYHGMAAELGVDIQELYQALVTDGEVTPPEWDVEGRQIGIFNQYGYVPYAVLDTSSTGRQTREGSRTLEYAFNDFAIRQVAQLLNNTDDVIKYTNRSMNYRNVWDATVDSDGYMGFMQKRFPNGTFSYQDPINCSPADNSSRSCSLQPDNENGFYESSAWEYSFFAPHDTAGLVELMGGNETFVSRLDHFFDAQYYLAGNEPSFQTPTRYHYADHPAMSVDRVRQVVYENFDTSVQGLPGNDDQAAMATFLIFHLLGLYPTPSTTEYLIVSPFMPKYTIRNALTGVNTTVTAVNFDERSLNATIPNGVAAYVKTATFNGQRLESRCHFDFYDIFAKGGDLVLELTADKALADSCAGSLPASLSTGGWSFAA